MRLILLLIPFLLSAQSITVSRAWYFAQGSEAGGGSEWTVDDDFSSDTSSDYTGIKDGIAISDGVAYGSNDWATNWVYHETSLGSADQVVEALCRSVGSYTVGPGFRCNGTTGYFVSMSSTNNRVYLYSFNGTSETEITNSTAGTAFTDDAEHWVRVEASGTSIDVYVDINDDGDFEDTDELVAEWTDSTYSSGNYCGMYLRLDAAAPPHVSHLRASAN